jgi:plastocyanin
MPMARLRSRPAVFVATVVLSLGAAACGSSTAKPSTSAAAAPPASAQVRIVGFMFKPMTVTVRVGGTVTWMQVDAVGHSVESTTHAWATSKVLAPGQTFTHTFTAAGTYPYICGVHPYMTGTVSVVK